MGVVGLKSSWMASGSGSSDGVAVMGYSLQWVGVKISREFMASVL